MASTSRPEAVARAEHQLEMLLKPGGAMVAYGLQDELEICWLTLKEDPTVADPVAVMDELGEWFAAKFREAIAREIAASPIEEQEEEE